MRSEVDCVWEIAVQRASVRRRGKTCSERVRRDSLISQDLCRSNTVGYNPHLCKQNDDAVWCGEPGLRSSDPVSRHTRARLGTRESEQKNFRKRVEKFQNVPRKKVVEYLCARTSPSCRPATRRPVPHAPDTTQGGTSM